jgi:hypothetical protein
LAFSLIERVFTVSGLTPSLRFPELGNMPGRFSNLLVTKLHPPRAGSDEVVRPRLLEAIDHGTRAKLTVIVTPAGYGKSTLAAQWQRRAERACCWLTLDSADNDPLVFFDYLMGAIHSIDPCLCPATEALCLLPDAREKFAGLVRKTSNGARTLPKGWRPEKVVFGMMVKRKTPLTADTLFPHAQIALARMSSILKANYGVEVEVIPIAREAG